MKQLKTTKIIAFAALAIFLAGCNTEKEVKQTVTMENIQAQKGKPVRIVTVGSEKMADMREFNGTIEGSQQASAIAKMSDPIAKINVQVGANVQKDQVLAEFTFTGDNSSYQQAEAQVKLLEKSLARMKEVQAKGGISQQDIDQSQTSLDVAKMQLEQARRATLVLAPAAGTVTDVRYKVGEVPSVGSVLFTIANLNQVILKLNVTTQDIGLFKKGAEATVTLNGETLKGKVTMVPLAADSKTRFFPVEITFPNKGRKLLPGMFVTASIHTRTVEGVTIPNDAVVYKDGVNFAWIVDKDGNAKRKIIRLGVVGNTTTQVVSGIELGDKVITEGVSKMNDGDKVMILD
jgi:membrane fusion protein, multidrug efflux system